MSDIADDADARTEQFLAVMRDYRKPELHLYPIGVCRWCESAVRSGEVFCGGECRDDFCRDRQLREMAGKL